MQTSILAAVFLGLVGLSGCAKIHYPSYYTLNIPSPVSGSSHANPISGTVTVREFRSPQYLRQGPIAYRPQPEQIAFYDFHYWAEDPRKVATQAMIRELQTQGIFKSSELYDGRGTPEFLVTGSLDQLEEVDRGTSVSVTVGLSAKLQDLKTGETVWSESSSKTTTVEQHSISGLVAEMSRDLSETVKRLVSSMAKHVSSRSVSSR